MAKIQKHIEIVRTNIVGLSSMSEKSCAEIFHSLQQQYETVGISTISSLRDLDELISFKPDIAFVGFKFLPKTPHLGRADSEKIWVTDYLEDRGIACTGSPSEALKLELDKELAKIRIAESGIKTAGFVVARQGSALDASDITLTYPLFVKPTDRGGGLGVDEKSIVNNFAELQQKVQSIAILYDSDALIEEYLPGREFSVAILRHPESDQFNVLPLELVAEANSNGERVLSAELKNANEESVLEVTDLKLKNRLCKTALRAFHALGAEDYGRIDIRLDANGIPNFLEANLIPCLISGYGNFPKACMMYLLMDHESMIRSIVSLAMPNEPEDLLLPRELHARPMLG